jgi:hypothetical protein
MSLPGVWPQVLDFCGTPLATEPSPGQRRFVPSTRLGGDMFGSRRLDPDHLAVYLPDISGRGVGSSLLAVSAANLLSAPAPVTVYINVNKAQLTVTADDQSKAYDRSAFAPFTAAITGFVNGDTGGAVSGGPGFTGSAVGAVNAGGYTVTPTVGSLSAAR